MTYPDDTFERAHGGPVAGVDEAGRGPLAGPVVAAAVVLDLDCFPDGLRDSKLLPAAARAALHAQLIDCAHVGVGMASVEEIDRLNILHASMLAMCRAVEALNVPVTLALIDGNYPPKLPCSLRTVVKGDQRCVSIAAASIIAKVTRDRMMAELARQHPGYGWETNAGYGTPVHCEALARLGVTPHHRRSFAPVRECLERAA